MKSGGAVYAWKEHKHCAMHLRPQRLQVFTPTIHYTTKFLSSLPNFTHHFPTRGGKIISGIRLCGWNEHRHCGLRDLGVEQCPFTRRTLEMQQFACHLHRVEAGEPCTIKHSTPNAKSKLAKEKRTKNSLHVRLTQRGKPKRRLSLSGVFIPSTQPTGHLSPRRVGRVLQTFTETWESRVDLAAGVSALRFLPLSLFWDGAVPRPAVSPADGGGLPLTNRKTKSMPLFFLHSY